MNNNANSVVTLVAIVLVALLLGCNRVERLPTAPTRGVILFDNQPVASAHVTFTPERGRSASAETKSDGSFVLGTYDPDDGAIVGEHFVTVTARDAGEVNTPGAPGIARPGRSRLPERYGNTGTSGLRYKVEPGQENVFEIRLTTSNGK